MTRPMSNQDKPLTASVQVGKLTRREASPPDNGFLVSESNQDSQNHIADASKKVLVDSQDELDKQLDKWLWNLVAEVRNPTMGELIVEGENDLAYTKDHIKRAINAHTQKAVEIAVLETDKKWLSGFTNDKAIEKLKIVEERIAALKDKEEE